MKRILLFGSTGSIGRNVLDIVAKNRDRFRVELLSCNRNVELLAKQANEFDVTAVYVGNAGDIGAAKQTLPTSTRVFSGDDCIAEILDSIDADLVVNAIVGAAGLAVSYYALAAGKELALANKESMVAGGELLCRLQKRNSVEILPIDSEHSAIFQCLQAGSDREVEKIILTASGGPFRTRSAESFDSITKEEALKHPNWSMGPKITIDSATMMNKCLEVIEAHYLFGVEPGRIEVVIHPESVIHSMVQFHDGAVIAQLSPPDMRLPIAYALNYPERLPTELPRADFGRMQQLRFEKVDDLRFPAIKLAYSALERGGTAPLILNASNEIAVEAFLAGEIKFRDITAVVSKMVGEEVNVQELTLDNLLNLDRATRERTRQVIAAGTFTKLKG